MDISVRLICLFSFTVDNDSSQKTAQTNVAKTKIYTSFG